MGTRAGKPVERTAVPVGYAVVATIALVLFIAWRGWLSLKGPSAGPLPPPPTQDINFVMQKAVESQGDFSKLSTEDQTRVQTITHGWGKSAISSDWRKHKAGQ